MQPVLGREPDPVRGMEHGKHTDAEQYKFGQRIPLAQKWFMLDPSNVAITSMALGIGVARAAVIEVLWWVQGALMGERRRL